MISDTGKIQGTIIFSAPRPDFHIAAENLYFVTGSKTGGTIWCGVGIQGLASIDALV